MQWLLNILRELIDTTDIYIDRGDIPSADFTIADFVRDGIWHDWDVSAIVPENVTAVNLRVTMSGTAANRNFSVRTAGNVNGANVFLATIQNAGIFSPQMGTVYPSAARHLEYKFSSVTINSIFITINGWWLKRN